MNTFTVKLEEPGKSKLINFNSSTEARKNGNFGRSHHNYWKTQEVFLKAASKLLIYSLAQIHLTGTTKHTFRLAWELSSQSFSFPFHFLSIFMSYQ